MIRSCQSLFLLFMHFIAIANLSHKPSWAGCIKVIGLLIVDWRIRHGNQYWLQSIGHARLWVYVVGTDEFRWSHAFCLVFALTVPSIMYFSLNMESVELVKGDSSVVIPIEARWDPFQKGCNLYLHKRTGRWWRDTLRGYTASGLAVYPHP